MFFQALLSFLLIRHLQRTLKNLSLLPEWNKVLTRGMYGVIVLFIIESVFSAESVTRWIWHALLLLIIGITFKRRELASARTVMFAVLPVVLVSLIKDLMQIFPDHIYKVIVKYTDYAFPVAVTWMIAMLILYSRQQRTFKKEHQKRLEEEEQNRMIAARKAELETLVAERTAELTQQKEELQHTLVELKSTQTQLIQREKMASLGELTAGIAHEIQNPLNFVNNFSEVNVELANELMTEINALPVASTEKENFAHLINDLILNQQKIAHHGKRADSIVKGMLLHSRKSTGNKELTDINALVNEYLHLSYHGLRAKDKAFNVTLQTHFDESIEKVNIVPQDMGRVLLNLFNNAFYATSEKKKNYPDNYQPTVSVTTEKVNEKIEIIVKDNGMGIPQKVVDKIFQPFFTTKPTGQGTGLGLSLSYDIIKAHGGELKAETKEGEYAEFIIGLPQ